jgi:release factor glutamine methyltransferase
MNPTEKSEIWTIGKVLNWGTEYLGKKSIESPRLTIELLLCDILSSSRLDLYLSFDKPLSSEELQSLKSKIKRILKGEPIQYVLGWTQFLNYKILLRRNVFIPRPETEFLVSFIRNSLKSHCDKPLQILDIGCGSGAISIALADFFKNSQVLAVDIDENAIIQTIENGKLNKIENIQVQQLDILNKIPQQKFDLIVSNPPYIPFEEYKTLPKHIKNEPKIALTDDGDGLKFYRRFTEIFPVLLNNNGSFFLEVAWNQAEQVSNLFRTKDFDVLIEKDLQGIKRIIYCIRF